MLKQHTITLIALEESISLSLKNSKIKGIIDRVDQFDGKLRIVDYKTGAVDSAGLNITELSTVFSEKKHTMALQLLTYALMTKKMYDRPVELAAIIPIKKLGKGEQYLKFNKDKSKVIKIILLKNLNQD